MRKALYRIAGLVVSVMAGTFSLPAQTVEDILEKMVEARGGAEALRAVMDFAVYGDIQEVSSGLSYSYARFWKSPGKSRVELQNGDRNLVSILNGETGWANSPRSPKMEKLPSSALKSAKRNALPMDAICDPARYGETFVLKGRESVSGRDCFILEKTDADGFKEQLYVDSQSFLVIKSKYRISTDAGASLDGEVVILAFKKVGGVVFSTRYISYFNGREVNRTTIADIKINTGLTDSLFEPEK